MTGERNGCNGGMSRHRRFDPSNNLDGSTAALRKRFGERLLLALKSQLMQCGGWSACWGAAVDLASTEPPPSEAERH